MEILSVEFKDTEILTERDLTDIARYVGPQKAFEIFMLIKREKWLIKQLAGGGERFCPMPEDFQCSYKSGDNCSILSDKKRKDCWREASEKATWDEIMGEASRHNFNPEEGLKKLDEMLR